MEEAIEIDINSGVHANVGFDFQRNSCIYIFLEKYKDIKDSNYFIMLEHYDDVIFGFMNDNQELSELTTYQAKKSSTEWTNSKLFEILKKMLNVGIAVTNDSLSKSKDYKQRHYFLTNNNIKLSFKESQKSKYLHINETNEDVALIDTESALQDTIKKGGTKIKFTNSEIAHFDKINLRFIDLGRNSENQRNLLIGKFIDVFQNSIIDHPAALDTLVLHLKKIETKYNQGQKLYLEDKFKRIDSAKINEIISVLTTNKLALEYCRDNAQKLFKDLKIKIFDQDIFLMEYENSLDRFKDLTQAEHQKIINFIKNNKSIIGNCYDLIEAINEILDNYTKNNNTILNETQLKAAISAGCFLISKMK